MASTRVDKFERHALLIGDNQTGRTELIDALEKLNKIKLYPRTPEEGEKYPELYLHFWKMHGVGYEQLWNQHEISVVHEHKTMVLCFAIDDRPTFKNVKKVWKEMLEVHCKNSPVVLVGCKLDTRRPGEKCYVSREEGKKMARAINAYAYVECSVRKELNIEMIIKTILQLNIDLEIKRNKKKFLSGLFSAKH